MKEFWDSRYSSEEYAYGVQPNEFLKAALDKYNLSGKILLPAEGEGRNGVYAAKKGLEVYAFDVSEAGKKKAEKLAKINNVKINYEVGDFFDLKLINEKYDVAALIFAHFSPETLSLYHEKIGQLIKPNGLVILEGFSKNHLEMQKENPNVGGPKIMELLFSTDQIKNDFPSFEILQLEEIVVELNEGEFHKEKGKVIRFIGRKND
jgi:cyclopropane fatty-acyl-phospholipid synthase-like methyltransferase